jgi:histidine kinase-like protein
MSVVLSGRDLPSVPASTAALVALDQGAIDRELGLGRDRLVMVHPPATPNAPFGRLAHHVFDRVPVEVLMIVYPAVDPTRPDVVRWCDGAAAFGPVPRAVTAESGTPAAVRRLVAAQVEGCPASVRDAAPLAASELVTNALQHTGGYRVALAVDAQSATLAVFDGQPSRWPAPSLAEPLAASGRGLAIVAAIASTWGITAGRREKSVWCELR